VIHYTRYVLCGLAKDGFNGSMLDLGDKFAMVYRDDGPTRPDGKDDNVLRLRSCFVGHDYRVSNDRGPLITDNIDPRLFMWRDNLYMLTRWVEYPRVRDWRMELWPLQVAKSIPDGAVVDFGVYPDKRHFIFKDITGWPGGYHYKPKSEANWAPFVEDGALYFVHYPRPHRILQLDDDPPGPKSVYGRLRWITETDWTPPPGWLPDLRGSTPPIQLQDGTWLSTFHDHDASQTYRVGFYRFATGKPWRVVSASRSPVYDLKDAIVKRPWRYNVPNVFPLSLHLHGDLLRVAAGISGVQQVVDHFSLKDVMADMATV
jgi:hypothetical protein